MIRVVHVKSKTLFEEDGEDMYEKDLLYITTYMYMILSLHELISRCHLVNFDLLPPSTFKIHNMTQFCVFVFFLIKNTMILYILLFIMILKYKCVVAFHFYFFFFNVLPEGGGAWRDVPYMYFKVVINTIIHFSFSATRVISKCILIFPNKTDNSVHKAIIGKFKNISVRDF